MKSLHTIMKSHSIASEERIMHLLHLDLAKQKFDQQKSKNSIKKDKNSIKNWKYLIFSHTNRFDSLAELSQVRKTRFCTLRIDVCSQFMPRIRCITFFIDFSIISCLPYVIGIPYGNSTVKSHRYRAIDVARSIWESWDTMMLHDVIRTLVNIAKLRQLVLASWSIF